ncbi:MAG: glycosyltransferase family 2 protein, partial [Acidobacteriaceae bacterium]|nr:glycosyltransferase family 2 protein [Acidobacteriaceae bacterium]
MPVKCAPPAITVIIPAHNAAHYLRTSLARLAMSSEPFRCIVVDDGSTDDTREVASSFGADVVETGGRKGPAYARNMGARLAESEFLFFIDADVCVCPHTLSRILSNFAQDPKLDALMGSYDDSPGSKDFLSQYRNLMHCFVHQTGRREAFTFWSGCGAIRRRVFSEHSGFDESYGRPAIEDIELGYRMAKAGHKMILDAGLQVKHLKAWSFLGLVKTDILDRGVPWTELILRDKALPNDLNIQLSQRVSVALVWLLIAISFAGAIVTGAAFVLPLLALLFLMLGAFEAETTWRHNPNAMIGIVGLVSVITGLAWWTKEYWLAPPVLLAYVLLLLRHRYTFNNVRRRRFTGLLCGVYLLFTTLFVLTYLPRHPLVFCLFLVLTLIVVLNNGFYVFLASRTGKLLALAGIPFHLLFHFYNGLSFLIGSLRYYLRKD